MEHRTDELKTNTDKIIKEVIHLALYLSNNPTITTYQNVTAKLFTLSTALKHLN